MSLPVAVARRGRRAWARRPASPFEVVCLTLGIAAAVLILYPLLATLRSQLFPQGRFNRTAFVDVLTDPAFHQAALHTAIVIVVSGTAAIFLGGVFAWINERTDASFGTAASLITLVPLAMPPITLAVGWVFLADETVGVLNVAIRSMFGPFGFHTDTGPLNITSWPGLLFINVLYLVPFAFLVISSAFQNADLAAEEASRISGASLTRTLLRVSLPAVRPSLLGAALLLIIMGVAQYAFVRIIGIPAGIDNLANYMVRQIQVYPSHIDRGVVVGLLVLSIVGFTWWLERRVSASRGAATISGRSGSTSRLRLRRWRWPVRVAILLYLALTSVLPFAALAYVAFQRYWTASFDLSTLTTSNFWTFLSSTSLARKSLVTSVELSAAAALIAILLGATLSFHSRGRASRQRRGLTGVLRLPSAFSHIVIGVAFLAAFAGEPFGLYGTVTILLLAYIVVDLPQASIIGLGAVERIGRELLDASATSGAGLGRTYLKVCLPLMRSSLVAGWALLFAVLIGDLTVSAILAGPANPTVGFAFLATYDQGTFSQLAALGTLVSVVAALAIGLVLILNRPRIRTARRG